MSEPRHSHSDEEKISEGAQALAKTLRLGFILLQGLLLFMLLVYVSSGVFILNSNEEALVLRFGAIVGTGEEAVKTSGKGHWAFPKPMDHVIRISVNQSKTVRSNHFWHQEQAANLMTNPDQPQPPPEDGEQTGMVPMTDGYLVTADTNILHTKWEANYLISDPIAYYKNYADPEAVIKATMENVVLKQVAALPIELALYQGAELRERIGTDLNVAVHEALAREIARLDVGVDITNVNYVDKKPPKSTISAFRRVTNADQEADKMKNEARAFANEVLQRADGRRQELVSQAEAYSSQYEASVNADMAYFEDIKKKYDADGSSVLLGLYTNALRQVVGNAKEKYIVHPNQEVRVHISPKKKSPNTPDRTPPGR